MAKVSKKIYVFNQSKELIGYSFVALAEDGTCLSAWVSNSEESAKSEAKSAERLEAYNTHYPEGYELVWRGGPVVPDTMSSQKPGLGGSRNFIEGRVYDEFLSALTCY